jgi:hypothetical protein
MKKNLSTNPYDVIGVSQAASNTEITKSFAMAMKRREYSPDAIAKARKSLMNPQERIIADYLRPILPTIKRFKRQDFSELNTPTPTIEWLSEFDRLDEEISNAEEVSAIDRKLGLVLFSSSRVQA